MKKILFLLLCSISFAQTNVGNGNFVESTGDATWSGTVTLNGKYIVNDGHVLTIDAGTTILATNTNSVNTATAIVVRPGGQIFANGTASSPIIMKAQDAIDATDTGLWGGVIILGNATVGTPTGEDTIEGLPSTLSITYGGGNSPNDADNSGVFKYVSIQNGGTAISDGNEINGLTLGGVGSATEIHHVEIVSNDDDGIEFFGGTVDVSDLVIIEQSDDAVDVDQAYNGTISNVVVVLGNGSDNVFEIDGNEDKQEVLIADRSHNVTHVSAYGHSSAKGDAYGHWKSDAKGVYTNVLYENFKSGTHIEGIVEGNYADNSLDFNNFEFVTSNTRTEVMYWETPDDDETTTVNEFEAHNIETDYGNTAEWSNVANSQTQAVGANLAEFIGWSILDDYITMPTDAGNAYGNANYVSTTGDVSFSGNVVLDGKIIVEAGHTLYVQSGTEILGVNTGSVNTATAIVVRPGGFIQALGTADAPIVMKGQDALDLGDKGLWGGVIVLGNATVGTTTGEDTIEGLPSTLSITYGGGNSAVDNDGSGVFQYVSIQNGGTAISDGNEINGLTLGGVGSNSHFDNVEIVSNDDDGVEFFGGTVSMSNILIYNQSDDAVDVDQAYNGTITNVLVELGDGSDNVFEIDGNEDKQEVLIADRPHKVNNVTAYGHPSAKGDAYGHWKSDAKGVYTNVLYKNFKAGTHIEGIVEGNYADNSLDFNNFEFVTSNTRTEVMYWETPDDDETPENEFEAHNIETDYGNTAEWATINATASGAASGADTSVFGWTAYSGLTGAQDTLSFEEIVNESSLILYPNPFSSEINILSSEDVRNISVFNVLGQAVKSVNDAKTIDVSDIDGGIYIIQVSGDNFQSTHKMIKQ